METRKKTIISHAPRGMLAAVVLAGCSGADRREVYRGANGQAVGAIVREINAAERTVLATSPAYPRSAVAEALAAARRRGVQVDFVVCGKATMAPGGAAAAEAELLPVRFDRSHDETDGGRVFVIDERTVIRSAYQVTGRGDSATDETVMVIREAPALARRTAAECRRHAGRAEP